MKNMMIRTLAAVCGLWAATVHGHDGVHGLFAHMEFGHALTLWAALAALGVVFGIKVVKAQTRSRERSGRF